MLQSRSCVADGKPEESILHSGSLLVYSGHAGAGPELSTKMGLGQQTERVRDMVCTGVRREEISLLSTST